MDTNSSVAASRDTFQRAEILQRVAEDLTYVTGLTFRVVRSKLIKATLADSKMDITPLYNEVIRLLEEEGTLHCAEIGRRLQIAKAQVTKITDKLVALNLVERKIDTVDRRVLNISLTKQGKAFLKKHKNILRSALETSMSSLTDKELEELSSSFRKIQDILFKLE